MTRPGVLGALRVRLAVDIGGTFTDLVAVDTVSGDVVRAKTDTTPDHLSDGVLAALAGSGVSAESNEAFIHGTTVVINAVTERRCAPTALVTTRPTGMAGTTGPGCTSTPPARGTRSAAELRWYGRNLPRPTTPGASGKS